MHYRTRKTYPADGVVHGVDQDDLIVLVCRVLHEHTTLHRCICRAPHAAFGTHISSDAITQNVWMYLPASPKYEGPHLPTKIGAASAVSLPTPSNIHREEGKEFYMLLQSRTEQMQNNCLGSCCFGSCLLRTWFTQ